MLKEKTRLESSSQVVERKEEDEMAIFYFWIPANLSFEKHTL
jgi:hypothetical protein